MNCPLFKIITKTLLLANLVDPYQNVIDDLKMEVGSL